MSFLWIPNGMANLWHQKFARPAIPALAFVCQMNPRLAMSAKRHHANAPKNLAKNATNGLASVKKLKSNLQMAKSAPSST